MFANVRKAIASFIAPAQVTIKATQEELSKARSVTKPTAEQYTSRQREAHKPAPLVGNFHVSHLDSLHSNYLKNAIAQLGAWSALARAFTEFVKVQGKRTQDETKLGQLFDEFHCWNAAIDSDKQMDEEAILLATDKIAEVKPPKGNDQTDAIIARVRRMSVDEVLKDRMEKAAKQTAERQELIIGFTQAVWSFTSGDMNPSIASAKVAAKAVQTLEWVATNWQGQPEGIAAELLLIEADIHIIEKMARDAEERGDDTFEQGTLAGDGLIRNAKQSRRFGDERSNFERVTDDANKTLDMEAYREWQVANGK